MSRFSSPIVRANRVRLEATCEVIRDFLHIKHIDSKYIIVEDKETTADASTKSTYNGWYCRITLYPLFFKKSYEDQIKALIHEHIHVLLIPFQQQVDEATTYLHGSHRSITEDAITKGLEISVCHLEGVLFELLKEKLL